MSEVYTVRGLADKLKCSPDIIYDLLTKGKLEGFKIGKAWRIKEEAVIAYIDNQAKKKTERKGETKQHVKPYRMARVY